MGSILKIDDLLALSSIVLITVELVYLVGRYEDIFCAITFVRAFLRDLSENWQALLTVGMHSKKPLEISLKS